jgi:hypothetical protein
MLLDFLGFFLLSPYRTPRLRVRVFPGIREHRLPCVVFSFVAIRVIRQTTAREGPDVIPEPPVAA